MVISRWLPRVALVGVLAASVPLPGCGGSSSEGPDKETLRVNLRSYASKLIDTIEETGTSIEVAAEDLSNDPRLSDPDITVRRTAVRETLQPVRDALTEAWAELESAEVPEPMSDAHAELVSIVETAASGMDDLLRTVREIDSSDDFERVGEEIDELFSDLDEEAADLCPSLQDVLDDEGVDFDLEC